MPALKMTWTLALVWLVPFASQAGPWRIKPGSGSAVALFSYLKAERYSDGLGDKQPLEIQEGAATVFGTYGLFPDFAIGAAIAPHKIFWTDGHAAMGITDLEIWCDHHVATLGAWQWALRYQVTFPVGLENPAWTPDDLYAIHSQGALAASLLPMIGFSHGNFWLQGWAGAKLRGRDLAAQGKFQIDAGARLGQPWISGRVGLSGLLPLDSKTNGMPSDQEAYLGNQWAVEFRLPRLWRLGFQFDTMIPPGQALPQGLRSNLYLGWSWI
jgi:hypothetical protein